MVDYLETLRLIATGMGPQQSLQASIGSVLKLLSQQQDFIRPHLVIFDPQTKSLRLSVAGAKPRTTGQVYTPGVGVTGQVFVTGRPVILACMEQSSLFLSKFFERSPDELKNLAFISVPVLAPRVHAQQKDPPVLGVLSVDIPKNTPKTLTEKCAFLEVVAAMLATQGAYLQAEMLKQTQFWPSQIADLSLQVHHEDILSQTQTVASDARYVSSTSGSNLNQYTPSQLDFTGISFPAAVENFEREFLQAALHKAKGNMQKVARNLNTSYRIINYKVKKYNLLP